MRALCVVAVLCLAAVVATGCGGPDGVVAGDSGLVETGVSRERPSEETGADISSLVAANNGFGLALFREVRSPAENIVCSPYGLSTVLAMTLAGASGVTEQEMTEVLRFDLAREELHPAFNALDLALTASGELQIANAVWGDDAYSYDHMFVERLAMYYGAGFGLLDFAVPEEARKVINDWVSEKTGGRIPEVAGPGAFKPGGPVLMLVDAVYFKADWEQQFSSGSTRDLAFKLLGGTTVSVPMMNQEKVFPNGRGDGFQALELPYAGGRYSMVLVLPDEGTFEGFTAAFDDATLAEVLGSLEKTEIEVVMPRFEYLVEPAVEEALKAMGMTKMFDGRGDFMGVLDTSGPIPEGLWVGGVRQKAFISVGELGTEAAAATVVTMVGGDIQEHNEIVLNRPFLYLIRDRHTGQVVFVGQVVDPSRFTE